MTAATEQGVRHRRRFTDSYSVDTETNAQRRARGLGWFSIGLGLAQIGAPRALARLIGISDDVAMDRIQAEAEASTVQSWAETCGDGQATVMCRACRVASGRAAASSSAATWWRHSGAPQVARGRRPGLMGSLLGVAQRVAGSVASGASDW